MAIDTRAALLQHAEFFIRTQGYSAFSYADLADCVGIRKASIHYHFPRKDDLIQELLSSYRAQFHQDLRNFEAISTSSMERLRAYGDRFAKSFDDHMLPFCCALAAERSALPESVRSEVHKDFMFQLEWLSRIIGDGIAAGQLSGTRPADEVAVSLLSALEGGSIIGWALQERRPVLAAFTAMLETLELD